MRLVELLDNSAEKILEYASDKDVTEYCESITLSVTIGNTPLSYTFDISEDERTVVSILQSAKWDT